MEFAELTAEHEAFMNGYEFDRHTITFAEMALVRTVFGINDDSTEETLRAIRNSVVRWTADKSNAELADDNFKGYMRYSATQSAITAVIDNVLFNMGCLV